MSNDESILSQFETSQWFAIVTREWPDATTELTAPKSFASDQADRCAADEGTRVVTVYRPRRPALAPLVLAALALSAGARLIVEELLPTYRLATLPSTSRHNRVAEIHHLTVAAELVAVALVLAVGFLAVWVIAAARYRLRRSSCDQVTGRSIPMTRYVRPPNPATAATWTLLLLTASALAEWLIPLQLSRSTGNGLEAVEALHSASAGTVTWLAIFALSATGLTTWAARQSRHCLNRAASRSAARERA